MPDKWDQYVETPAAGDKWAQYAEEAPASQVPSAPQKGLGERTLDVIGQGVESTMDLPKRLMTRGRQLFQQSPTIQGKFMAPLRAESEEVNNALKGLWQSTTLGMIGQPPENKIAGAMMTMAGAGEGGETVRGLEEAAGKPLTKALEKAQTPVRVVAQEMGGAGREPVEKAAIARKAVESERASKYAEQKASAQKAHQEAIADAQAKYQKASEDYRNATEQNKSAYAEKVRKARENWVQKTHEARQAQAESARVDAQKQTLQRGQETYSEKLRQNLQQTYQTVKSRLDARWNHLRETPVNIPGALGMTLKDLPLNSKRIADTVDIAEQKYLQGSPDSIKQFRDLMGWLQQGEGQMTPEGGEGTTQQLRPITWGEARTHYSALGDRMFSGDLPGNIVQAIKFVRDSGLGEQLRTGAEKAGTGPQYSSLLKDWSNFEGDWRDMSSVTTKGGSPLARARMAPNAATLAPQITGKTGDLVLQRMAKYKEYGASIPLAEGVRKLGKQISDLPSVRVPKAPGPLELPAEPKAGERPEYHPQYQKEVKPPEQLPPIDPVAIRRMRLLEHASRPFRGWDILPPVLAERLLLKNPKFLEWVASQKRNEITSP